MTITAASVGWALLWSAVAAVVVWFALLPVRRRSLTGVFASVVLTGTAASVGALLGAIHAMLLPTRDWMVVVLLTAAAGGIATIAAGSAARRITQDNRSLRRAVADLAAGRVPSDDGRPLTAEIEQVRRELAATATALARTREREHALESARRELVSWVSHDLRTPLAGLRAMAEALEDGMVDDPAPYYKQIGASVDRLSGMVDDLFDLSRIRSGNPGRSAEVLSVDDLVSDVLAGLAPLAAARGVRLRGIPAGSGTVRGDGPQLDRALTNLAANAIRHTPEGGLVEMDAHVVAGGRLEVSVRDECGGIPVDDLPRLFDVGFRGSPARTPYADGSTGAGLGLAITRGIVEAHGGTVDVANAPVGCVFTVCLPTEVV